MAAVRAASFAGRRPVGHGDIDTAVGVIAGVVAVAIAATKLISARGRMVGNFTIRGIRCRTNMFRMLVANRRPGALSQRLAGSVVTIGTLKSTGDPVVIDSADIMTVVGAGVVSRDRTDGDAVGDIDVVLGRAVDMAGGGKSTTVAVTISTLTGVGRVAHVNRVHTSSRCLCATHADTADRTQSQGRLRMAIGADQGCRVGPVVQLRSQVASVGTVLVGNAVGKADEINAIEHAMAAVGRGIRTGAVTSGTVAGDIVCTGSGDVLVIDGGGGGTESFKVVPAPSL